MAASDEMTNFQSVIFGILTVIAGLVITFRTTLLIVYYNAVLKERKFLGDILFLNAFSSLEVFYITSVLKNYCDEDDLYWTEAWHENTKRYAGMFLKIQNINENETVHKKISNQ